MQLGCIGALTCVGSYFIRDRDQCCRYPWTSHVNWGTIDLQTSQHEPKEPVHSATLVLEFKTPTDRCHLVETPKETENLRIGKGTSPQASKHPWSVESLDDRGGGIVPEGKVDLEVTCRRWGIISFGRREHLCMMVQGKLLRVWEREPCVRKTSVPAPEQKDFSNTLTGKLDIYHNAAAVSGWSTKLPGVAICLSWTLLIYNTKKQEQPHLKLFVFPGNRSDLYLGN